MKIKELEHEIWRFEQEADPEFGQNYVRITYDKDKKDNKDTKDLAGFNFKENLLPKKGVKFSQLEDQKYRLVSKGEVFGEYPDLPSNMTITENMGKIRFSKRSLFSIQEKEKSEYIDAINAKMFKTASGQVDLTSMEHSPHFNKTSMSNYYDTSRAFPNTGDTERELDMMYRTGGRNSMNQDYKTQNNFN